MFKHRYICTMTIEKDLQQAKPFKNDHERALVNLLFTSRFVESKFKSIYKEYGVTMKQYNILRILKGAGEPISTQLIRERMIDRMSDISRIVDRMIDKGIVTKCLNGADKRLVDITLSKKGEEVLNQIKELAPEHQAVVTHLTKKECVELNRILDKIRGYN